MNTFAKTLIASSISAALIGLTACGGGGKKDEGSTKNVQMSGAVVDGFIAFSTIYADVNNNYKKDSFEPSAITDEDGYFTISKNNQNYCDNPRSDAFKHCLQLQDTLQSGTVIRIVNGLDLITDLPYQAAMSMQTDGSTNGLRVTSGSSFSQIGGSNKSAFLTYIQTLAGSTNPNSINHFDANANDDLYRFVFMSNKLAEALAAKFSDAQPAALKTSVKDFSEAEWNAIALAALFNALDFSSDPYLDDNFDLDVTATNTKLVSAMVATMSEISGKSETVINPLISSNLDDLDYSTDIEPLADLLYANLDITVGDTKEQLAYIAEIATKSIEEVIKGDSIDTVQTIVNETNLIHTNRSNTFDYQTNDFESVVDIVTNTGEETAIANLTAGVESFETFVTATLLTKYIIAGTNAANDQYRIQFKQGTQRNVGNADEYRDGDLVICKKEPNETPSLMRAAWSWDKTKNYTIYAEYLSQGIVIKNLDPVNQNCNAANGGTNPASCMVVSAPDNSGGYQNTYAVDATVDWNNDTNSSLYGNLSGINDFESCPNSLF